jgi:hypothetical protein
MDYAFAPGVTGYDSMARQLFLNRPNTQLITGRGLTSVDKFLDHLDNTAGLTLPADDLYLVSHGNAKAWMAIPLDVTQVHRKSTDATTFETAEAAVTSGSVNIPNGVNHDSGGTLNSMSVNIRGCRIGSAEPFVDKLKEAFGGDSPVTAAKHFHEVYQLGSDGMMEFLFYGFTIVSQTGFTTKADLAQEFDNAALTFHDGTDVPTANWTTWLPTNIKVGHRKAKDIYAQLGTTLGKWQKIGTTIDFRHDQPPFTYKISGLSQLPAAADRLQKLHDALDGDAATPGSTFASDHPLPTYVRWSQDSIDDFVNNLNWKFSWDKKNSIMVCVGRQHEYTVLVPVTDPPDLTTGKLIYNFYPPAASPLTAIKELKTSDGTLFYTA